MKITDVETIPLKLGTQIVRVHTDDGITGIGEASRRSMGVFEPFVADILKPIIVGKDPRNVDRLWDDMFHGTSRLGPKGLQTTAIGAVNIACWDLIGKAAKLPVSALLGGAARTTIKAYWSVGSGGDLQPDQMLEKVREGYELGFQAFKIRMDWRAERQDTDPEKDFEMFRLCREFLPSEYPLGFDANNGYSVSTAIQQGRRFEELGIAHFEEPLPPYDYLGLKQVADALDVPISTGEQEHTRWDFRDLILTADPDILQPDVVMAGGISEMRRIFALAETFNKPVMPHCPSSGIMSAASLHVYSTLTNAPRPHEYSWEISGGSKEAVDALFVEPLELKDGHVTLPQRPGLGLELDQQELERQRASG